MGERRRRSAAQGVDARLVVFNRGRLHPEADESLDLDQSAPRWRMLATQVPAALRLLPQTDVFHFYFGLTLVPKSLQFPLLRATRRKSVFHYLGSDIRGKTRAELAYGSRADAEIVGSYDAIRWVPDAHVVPPGLDLARVHAGARRPTRPGRSSSTRRRTASARARRT